jgi:hypothetical protein
MPSKTANKSALIGKGTNGKFQYDPNCPRFIPMLSGIIKFRNPDTGKLDTFADHDAAHHAVMGEFKTHPLHSSMLTELRALKHKGTA